MHAQVKLPDVLVHVAFGLHPPLFVAHSLMSLHVVPLPVKPVLHAQVKLPAVFVHVALTSHPPLFVLHSLMSVQVTPLPE